MPIRSPIYYIFDILPDESQSYDIGGIMLTDAQFMACVQQLPTPTPPANTPKVRIYNGVRPKRARARHTTHMNTYHKGNRTIINSVRDEYARQHAIYIDDGKSTTLVGILTCYDNVRTSFWQDVTTRGNVTERTPIPYVERNLQLTTPKHILREQAGAYDSGTMVYARDI